MIRLYLNGSPVALYTDTKIGITAMNPYFNETGAFSYPFTIPYKPNEAILLHAARIQSTATAKNFIWEAVLEVDGIQVLTGEAVAEGDFPIVEGTFPIVLRSAKTSFAKLLENCKMNGLDLGADPDSYYTTEEELLRQRTGHVAHCYPSVNYTIAPFYNPEAWDAERGKAKIPNYINRFDPVTASLDDRIDTGTQYLWNAITYSFYVRYILKKIIEYCGLALGEDDMASIPDLNRWFCLSLTERINHQNIAYRYSFSEITVREFLKTIRQFGIAIVVDEKNKTASIRLVRDIFQSGPTNNLLSANAFAETLVFSAPKDGYSIAYKGSGDPLAVQAIANNIIEVADFAALPAPSVYWSDYHLMYLVQSTGTYYMSVLQPKAAETDPNVFKWQSVGNQRPYVSGNAEEKIELNATVLGQRYETRRVTKSVYELGTTYTQTWDIDIEMPQIDQNMNECFFGGYIGSYKDFPLVFLFNWGMKVYYSPDTRVYAQYPIISGDAYARDQTSKGTISMRSHGEKSFIAQLVKDEQDWAIRRKQKRQSFRLSVIDCANFRWQDTYNISSVNYLVNSLRFDIGAKGISHVEAELFTV